MLWLRKSCVGVPLPQRGGYMEFIKDKFKDINDLQDMGIGSRSTILRRVERGELPQPIKFGSAHNSKYFWHEDVINAYLFKVMNGHTTAGDGD
ncbi:hypothetical protein OA493_01505 [Gammaproteobacteria bacterium]|nr:hypothetical protein [Gammaproteobacteria bacterium]